MAGLTGTQIKATYGDVLQCNNTGLGIDATVRIIQDGLGNNSALSLSTGTVQFGSHTSAAGLTFNQAGGGRAFIGNTASTDRVELTPIGQFCWSPTTGNPSAVADSGLARIVAKVCAATDGTSAPGKGWIQNSAGEAALASAFTNATATLAATNLSWSVAAGRSYRIIGILQVSNTTAAEGIKLAFDGGTATATTFFAAVTAIGSVVAGTLSSTTLAGVINFTTITGTDYIVIHGYLTVNAGGTLTLRAAENTTATGTLTIGAGSWIALADTVPL